jgi:type IV pilus assembly protein PilC
MTVLFIALALFSLIMQWLIPQFEEVILDFNAPLPLLSRCVFSFARAYPWLLMGVGIAAAAIIVFWSGLRATTRGRRFRERLLLAVPVVGRLVRVSLVARFFRSVSLSVAGGIPLPETLRMASQATGSPGLARDADRVAERIEIGESAARAGEAARLLPPVFGYVVDTAAARNTLPQATAELAKAYEMRAAHYQSLLRTWLVPLAVIFVAVSVGFCVVAMFWPLARLIQSVSV